MIQAAVSLKGLSKHYANQLVLKDIDLELMPGEILGLFGHNGAGKSTLMKICLGVVRPDAGSVTVMGRSPTANDSHHYRRQFGYLAENVSFYDQLTGREVLSYFAQLKGVEKKEVERLLDEVGLAQAAKRAVKNYSKGMRQRLGLAQALLGDPKLLLLDEPTVGLDPVATNDFYTTVDRLKSGGCSVILCSHVLPGVESHIDRAMILDHGQQLAFGSLSELRNKAALPVEIRVSGLSAEDFAELSAAGNIPPLDGSSLKPENTRHLMVPQEEKISVIRLLMGYQSLKNIELHEPSLETLYRHYVLAGSSDTALVTAPATASQHKAESLGAEQ